MPCLATLYNVFGRVKNVKILLLIPRKKKVLKKSYYPKTDKKNMYVGKIRTGNMSVNNIFL